MSVFGSNVNMLCQSLECRVQGGAPAGVEYIDVEEEYVVDEHGNGSWQQLQLHQRTA